MTRRRDFESALKPYRGSSTPQRHLQKMWEMAHDRTTRTVTINLRGATFVLQLSACLRIPLLSKLMTDFSTSSSTTLVNRHLRRASKGNMELRFEKHPDIFSAIVDYIQNHELHAPKTVCPMLFAQELNFWGFDVDDLEPCCYANVLRFLYEQEKLVKFHGFLKKRSFHDIVGDKSAASVRQERVMAACAAIRQCMWTMLEEPFTSIAGKIYFVITVFSILGSFATASAETATYFRLNHTEKALESQDQIEELFIYLDHVCIGLQIIDYALRTLFYAHTFIRFVTDTINVTDGIAMTAAILKLCIPVFFHCNTNHFLAHSCEKGASTFIYVVYLLQLLRFMRIIRPLSLTMEFRLLYYTLMSSLSELLLVFMLLLLLAAIFSFMLYYLGSTREIDSIPLAMWFSIITLTTVGLGDIVPDEDDVVSRVLGCCMAVLGVILLTMTTPIMVSNFHSLYLNAVVGQPSTMKKLHQQLAKDNPVSSSSSSSSEPEQPEKMKDEKTHKISFFQHPSEIIQPASSFLQACLGNCCPLQTQVEPLEDQGEEEGDVETEENSVLEVVAKWEPDFVDFSHRRSVFLDHGKNIQKISTSPASPVHRTTPSYLRLETRERTLDSLDEISHEAEEEETVMSASEAMTDKDSCSNAVVPHKVVDSDAFTHAAYESHRNSLSHSQRTWYTRHESSASSESEDLNSFFPVISKRDASARESGRTSPPKKRTASLISADSEEKVKHRNVPISECEEDPRSCGRDFIPAPSPQRQFPHKRRCTTGSLPREDKDTQTSAQTETRSRMVDKSTQTLPLYADKNTNTNRCDSHHHILTSESQPTARSAIRKVALHPQKERKVRKTRAFSKLGSCIRSPRAHVERHKSDRSSVLACSPCAPSGSHALSPVRLQPESRDTLSTDTPPCSSVSVHSEFSPAEHGEEMQDSCSRVRLQSPQTLSSGAQQRHESQQAKGQPMKNSQR